MTSAEITYTYFDSFVGQILIAQDRKGVVAIRFLAGKRDRPPEPHWEFVKNQDSKAVRQLRAYFNGKLKDFRFPLSLGGTSFEREVWQALQQIPYGQTISYGEVARRVKRPKAVRAVGQANGKNSIPIVIPCHRVIGSNGRLTGFGSGLDIKIALLEHERKFSADPGPRSWRE